MNFFDSQDQALRKTRYLLLLMTFAVSVIVASVTFVIAVILWISGTTTADFASFPAWAVANKELLVVIATGITAFIGLASVYRIITLSRGGGRVARELGGSPVSINDEDPLRRRLHNVVEEMALASGVPVPDVFVLDLENGINAFAAGFRPEDAAVAVTRGTLETLNREELQGVIAHEFSHILNGDMRLNIRLMGPLFGILSIGLIGRMLLRSNRRSSSRNKGAGAAVLLGIGLIITGYTGLLIGRLIKAGVSRQREYLADASAVQFTRQTRGIANALKKIAGLAEGSKLADTDAEEVSHMLFASGVSSFSRALASHPPLLDRIQALDPQFNAEAMAKLHTERSELQQSSATTEGISQFSDNTISIAPVNGVDEVIESAGHPDDTHILAAQSFLSELPDRLRETLSSPEEASLLPLALLMNPRDEIRQKQYSLLTQQLGKDRAVAVEQLHSELQSFKYETRLPLLDLAMPVIKRQPEARLSYLNDLLEQTALSDNRLEVYEYALLRIYQGYMQHALNPGRQKRWQNFSGRKMHGALNTLVNVFRDSERSVDTDWMQNADNALAILNRCTPRAREKVIRSILVAALGDGKLQIKDAELLRAFCYMLGCPLPPLLSAR